MADVNLNTYKSNNLLLKLHMNFVYFSWGAQRLELVPILYLNFYTPFAALEVFELFVPKKATRREFIEQMVSASIRHKP